MKSCLHACLLEAKMPLQGHEIVVEFRSRDSNMRSPRELPKAHGVGTQSQALETKRNFLHELWEGFLSTWKNESRDNILSMKNGSHTN